MLAGRHSSDRAHSPSLPARFEDPAAAGNAIEAALARPHSSGFAAVKNGRLLAYLVGDLVIDNVWGRSGWVRTPGCAYDPDVGVEIVRDLYAALGERWVDYGIFFHFALIPVCDPELIQAWFSLSFGIEQVHALIDLEAIEQATPLTPAGITIRQAGPADRHHLAEMSDVIWRTQVKAPVWGMMPPEAVSEVEAGWAGLVDEKDVTVWLALEGDRVVAMQGYWPAEAQDDNMLISEKTAHLSVAGTREEARGRGISTLLTHHGLDQTRAAGFKICETDWRSTNLLSSRFWPKRGFRPAVYRLVRRIDQRIAWADGSI